MDKITYILRHRQLNLLEDGVIHVAAYPNFFPVCYRNKTGVWKGLDVDILKDFAKKANLKIVLPRNHNI